MLLDAAHEKLGWPERDQILHPKGAGSSVVTKLADRKLGETLRRLWPNLEVRIGVLVADPYADDSNAPLAIICEFNRPVQDEALFLEAQRIGWHLCRSRALLTVEPHLLRSWSCCEPPLKALEGTLYPLSPEITEARLQFDPTANTFLSEQAAAALHWIEFVSDRFFERHQSRFPRDKCADHVLVENLKFVRSKLRTAASSRLPDHIIHDLLARTIFTQFLSQRKDSDGNAALNQSYLLGLFAKGVLSKEYESFEDVLYDRQDTYALFRHLNEHFNGDLFPDKGATPDEQEAQWQAEMAAVKPRHLELLSQFVGGRMRMPTGQGLLWPEYSFDTIPLELISCIYEEFVDPKGNRGGVHYTPPYIVDFILDGELPWSGTEWDLRILDPACGSGIFLVKAFQRLIYRWKNANPGEEPKAELLRTLLEKNLFGVDIHEEAVRVASFSLYLAMCDEIEPRHYWQQVRFPRLRGKNLVHSDFFSEDRPGFRTTVEAETFDLVFGNAPWGKATATDAARQWAEENDWGLPANDNVGTLFLAKAAGLAKLTGAVSLLQPASALLFNRNSTAAAFRKKLFERFKVTEIVNFSVLRFGIFARSVSPCCAVTLRAVPPDDEPLRYITPKETQSSEEGFRVLIDTQDVQLVYPDEAANDSWAWTALSWGSRRDLAFLNSLRHKPNLKNLEKKGVVATREGFIRGNRARTEMDILGRPVLEVGDFPASTFLYLDAEALPSNDDPEVHSRDSRDYSAFDLPQLILKQGWQIAMQRLRAAITESDERLGGVLCSQSYVSVHADAPELLETACLSYNSIFAVYFFYHTSGRLASYRPELQVGELLSLPFPKAKTGLLGGVTSLADVDECVRREFGLKDAEWMAVKDFFSVTLQDFKGGADSPGRQPTCRFGSGKNDEEPELREYCKHFLRVVKAGFGQDKLVCATIFHEGDGDPLPLRMVAIHLNWPGRPPVSVEKEDYPALRSLLTNVFRKALYHHESSPQGIYYQRTARLYETRETADGKVPTIYILKPDRLRYWTGSSAVRDADAVSADLMRWGDMQLAEPRPLPKK
jgi:hypothetical protein